MDARSVFLLFLGLTASSIGPGTGNPAWAAAPQPVIEMSFLPSGAGPAEPQPLTRPPELQILEDGTVRVQSPDRHATARLQPEQLRALLQELLTDYHLEQLTTERLQADAQVEGVRLQISSWIPGAEETLLRIRLADRTLVLRCHAVGLLATRFPQVQSLQWMLAAQERLQNIRALTLLGDGRQALELAQRATESLQAQHPGTPPLTSRNLSLVHTLPDGTRLVQFSRREHQPRSPLPQFVTVSLMESPGEQLRVTVMAGDSVLR